MGLDPVCVELACSPSASLHCRLTGIFKLSIVCEIVPCKRLAPYPGYYRLFSGSAIINKQCNLCELHLGTTMCSDVNSYAVILCLCVVSGGGLCLLSFFHIATRHIIETSLLFLCKWLMTKVEVKQKSNNSCKRLHHFIGTKEMAPHLISPNQ